METDVAVVGGGPAGACTALALARGGWKVRLVEAGLYDRPRYGETLPPETNPLLDRLGLRGEFEALSPLESPGTVSVWGGPDRHEQDFIRNAHGAGWHVDRARLDEMLWRVAERAGARVSLGTRVLGVSREGQGWVVAVRDRSGTRRWKARVLIDAAGRGRRPLCGKRRRVVDDSLVAVTGRFARASCDRDLRTYVEAVPGGWWYSAPVPHGETVAMFFTDLDVYRTTGVVPREHLAFAPLTRARIERSTLIDTCVLVAPSARREQVIGPGWLAVGDAAASFDPLSGAGVVRAIEGAGRAADATHRLLEGDPAAPGAYGRWVTSCFTAYARKRRLYYSAEDRWPAAGFWRRRRGAVTKGA